MDHVCYLSRAFSQEYLVRDLKARFEKKRFDAFIGCGLSGSLVVPLLAYVMNKRFAIVRKAKDCDGHSQHKTEGNLHTKDRWIFIDDLMDQGKTYLHTRKSVDATGDYTYAGMYLYQDIKWIPANTAPTSFFGDTVRYKDDTARYPK